MHPRARQMNLIQTIAKGKTFVGSFILNAKRDRFRPDSPAGLSRRRLSGGLLARTAMIILGCSLGHAQTRMINLSTLLEVPREGISIDLGLPSDSVLPDPIIQLARGDGSVVAENDDWSSATNAPEIRLVSEQVGAFSLPPGARDSALLVTLPPGAYTLTCAGKGNSEGVALVEVYFVP